MIHCMGECIWRLVGRAVNQVNVDTVKTQLAGGEEQIARHFERLNAVDGFLHVGMKVLNAHAEPVETHLANGFEVLAGSHSRIDFDADFAVGSEMETLARETD